MRLRALALVLPLLAIACGPPVTVRRVRAQDVYSRDSASVLDSGEPTRFATTEVHLAALTGTASNREKLNEMHRKAVAEGRPEFLLPLAELAFLEGEKTHQRSDFLGAAVYAYLYLFGEQTRNSANPWDPRTRIAADIYNRALARAFSTRDGDRFEFEGGSRRLPVGHLFVAVPETSIEWEQGVRFDEFLPADIYEITGLAARYRRPGLGAPLIAHRTPYSDGKDLFPDDLDIPATAFLRVEGDREDLRAGTLRGTLELYDPRKTPAIEVGEHEVPLESQTTTAYAYALGESPLWEFEFAGFLSGSDATIRRGISLLEPYRPDAIPVILVHGTASSPGRWAGLFNDLNNDPALRDKFQFWFFAYNSGNPIAYSALLLRRAIAATVQELDPQGDDKTLREMVLIGHSQGGLLVRLAISDSTELDYAKYGFQEPEEAEFDEETHELVLQLLRFKPLPEVGRAVFIATPHRGSYVAGGFLGQIGSALITISKTALEIPFQAIRLPVQLATTGRITPDEGMEAMPTAVDNMAPNSRFNAILGDIPMSPETPRHSIIAVQTNGPVERGNDGVVAYESAHIEDVESEIVVRSPHSVQSNSRTVEEVRRILLLHLEENGPPSPEP